ncbi:hypothetical protein [Paraburkholderia lycopersici]|uniref:Uncharacterized protein n=1 Tax=Paraburkholderia lycopersici TaxID=416944 RepID=A0A1G6Q260_9BURK|nr:hypothetical protein [Paraburkholderia lycopersici]SDC86530.1 hypothetical protein SAMN05421548_11162 [Paraburkholderia lycopersici]
MKTTAYDVRLGEIYYRYLLELARERPGATIRYGELVERAKTGYPNDELVQSAIPLSIGKRLLMIEMFCARHALPNLACLAVNASGRPGPGYKGNWEDEKLRVARFDWESCEQDWAIHVSEWRAAAQKPLKLVRRSRQEAEKVFMAHWRADAASGSPLYPNRLGNEIKEQIIKAIERGHAPEAAFQAAVTEEI